MSRSSLAALVAATSAAVLVGALAAPEGREGPSSTERAIAPQPVADARMEPGRSGDVIMPPAFHKPLGVGEVRYPSARIRMTRVTPGAGALPPVAARQAEEAFVRSKTRVDLATKNRSVVLTRFSDDAFGPEAADGTIQPLYQDVLAWVVTVHDAPVILYRHRGETPAGLPPACDFVYVVDATTGEPMTAFQACGRVGPG